ncbi:MAG: energy transducer TonB [Myxococcota bacterium]
MIWALLFGALAAEAPEGSPFADVPFFHHSSLKPTKRVEPTFPSVPPAEAAQRHRCIVWVKIGADGRPAQVTIVDGFAGDGCTAPFQQAATAAVSEWKWKPTKVGKEKATVHTQIAEVFAPQQSAPVIDVSLEARPPPEPVKQPKRPTGLPGDPNMPAPLTPSPRPAPAPPPAPAPRPPAAQPPPAPAPAPQAPPEPPPPMEAPAPPPMEAPPLPPAPAPQ